MTDTSPFNKEQVKAIKDIVLHEILIIKGYVKRATEETKVIANLEWELGLLAKNESGILIRKGEIKDKLAEIELSRFSEK